MRARPLILIILLLVFGAALPACGPLEQIMAQVQQGQATPVPEMLTARAQTESAMQTEAAYTPTRTATPTRTLTPTPSITPFPQTTLRPTITLPA
ncbi:MAG: hypothetical protein WHV44_11820, partial [Anaerolineales bacterium]